MGFLGKDILLYMWSKFTLNGMCYNLSRDCFNRNARLNAVLPGMIETRFYRGVRIVNF
ncbi:hypothetical protein HOLleu_37100 [Holothuria leucospilota]|uniref:Uncharacterized protein n=1 Tax=Holothuria leucospilota TaxID=206669 RepID=A0A9Q0YIQ6_HOLLE|nr:hypothetical protein HOLleu_37100 [Holothuria leucospilota]